MKTISIKKTVAAVAMAATVLTSGIAPISQASADMFNPVLTGKIKPMKPNPCLANPGLCGPIVVAPPAPPAPPPAPKPGINAGAAAALIVGGVIAGAALANAAQPKPVPSAADAHYAWCSGKYKSYRISDNSWQPYEGPRKPCISPYL